MKKDTDGQVTETAIEARAGFLDRPILVVLVLSTVLAAAVLFGLWAWVS